MNIPLRLSWIDRSSWPLVAVVALANFALFRWALDPLGLAGDDFINLAQAREATSLWRHLFRPVFGHLSPTHRLLHFFLERGRGAPPWSEVASVLSLVAALQVVALAGALRSLRVDARLVLLVSAWFAFAPTRADSVHWLASAGHTEFHLLFVLLGLWAALHGTGAGRGWPFALALGCWICALASSEKALLSVPVAALVVWREDQAPRRWFPVAVGALVIAAGIGMVTNSAGSAVTPNLGPLLEAYVRALRGPLASAVAPAGTGLWLLFGVVAMTVWWAESRQRALLIWGGSTAVCAGLLFPVTLARLTEMGPALGDLPRYTMEWLVVLLVSLGLVSRRQRRLGPLLVVLTVSLVGMPWRAAAQFEALRWEPGLRARAWTDAAQASLRRNPGAQLIEGEVPREVLEPFYWPWSRAEVVLDLLVPGSVQPLDQTATTGLELRGTQLVPMSLVAADAVTWAVAPGACHVEQRGTSQCLSASSGEEDSAVARVETVFLLSRYEARVGTDG